MDRHKRSISRIKVCIESLSARRAWIEIDDATAVHRIRLVALRKESVDRNTNLDELEVGDRVALRKESVDRNYSDDAE